MVIMVRGPVYIRMQPILFDEHYLFPYSPQFIALIPFNMSYILRQKTIKVHKNCRISIRDVSVSFTKYGTPPIFSNI